MKFEIVLSEADVQSIINGRDVIKRMPDGTKANIRLSYLKDVAAPMIKDRFEVHDTVVENMLNDFRASMSDTYRFGG